VTLDPLAIETLGRRIRDGQPVRFSPSELDAALSWLCGSQSHAALQLRQSLGQPHDSPVRVAILYRLLDQELMAGSRLDLDAAHLAGKVPLGERKTRFRLLIRAFHPDRYPRFSSWLTPRAQLIHQAYGAFKTQAALPERPTEAGFGAGTSGPGRDADSSSGQRPTRPKQPDHPWQPGAFRHSARLDSGRRHRSQGWVDSLRRLPLLAKFSLVLLLILALAMTWLALTPDEPEWLASDFSAPGVAEPANRPAPSISRASLDPPRPVRHLHRESPLSRHPALALPFGPPVDFSLPVLMEIEDLLDRMGHYVSNGDLDAVLRLVSAPPGHDAGPGPVAEHFADIIAGSRRRHQEFRILAIDRRPSYWSVLVSSRLTMTFDDLTARHDRTDIRLIIRRGEDGLLRISGFDA